MYKDPYFDIERVSNSLLSYYDRSPMHGKYSETHPREDEQGTLAFGAAFHCFLLESDSGIFDDRYLVFDDDDKPHPDKDYRNTENREWKKEQYLIAETKGKDVLMAEDYRKIVDMTEAVFSHKPAKDLLQLRGTEYEKTIEWEKFGIKCKAKIDSYHPVAVGDIKTTRDAKPKNFAKSVFSYGYHRQAGMYSEGATLSQNLKEMPGFFFIAVEKEPPYGVSVNWLDDDVIKKGIEEYHILLDQYKSCLESGKFPGYEYESTQEDGSFMIYLPKWMQE